MVYAVQVQYVDKTGGMLMSSSVKSVVVLGRLWQATFLERSAERLEAFDVDMQQLLDRILEFHRAPKSGRDQSWLSGRRDVLAQLHGVWRSQDSDLESLRDDLARQARTILANGLPGASQAVVLADFTNEALERLRAKEEETAAASGSQAEPEPAHGGFQLAETTSARDKYLAYFLKGTGRTVEEGAVGAWAPEPEILPHQTLWDPLDWTGFWLHLGGWHPNERGANTFDVTGWLALHYALQATVYWSKAEAIVRQLIPMMTLERLQAKTTGGRPKGYTALHMAANGSDKLMVRAQLCQLLLDRRVHVDPEDDQGRTPLHLAAGTGVLDTVKVLVAAGANVHHLDAVGKNCLDKCSGSSGQMKECPRFITRNGGLQGSVSWSTVLIL